MEGLKHYKFNYAKREEVKTTLKNKTFDVVVIGGGITGAGIALDAASRGLSVAVVEKQDYAAGTSSRSTKLIHGGLRYLKQLEVKLVSDVGKERAIAYKNAPHLVVPEKMLLPLVKGGSLGKFSTNIALWFYDRLAGVKGKDRRKMLSKAQTLEKEPLLRDDILLAGGYYAEYRTDDARLTLEILKTAYSYGALSLNYCEATALTYENEKTNGIVCQDLIHNEQFELKAKKVVNAAGPWCDLIRKKDNSLKGKRLHLTKGVHLVFPKEKFPLQQSVYFDVPGGRMIFAIPRLGVTYVGTTDTNYSDQLEEPNVTIEDVDYLLKSINNLFPKLDLTVNDIVSSWSGLRPLIHEDGKSPSELSRKDEVFISDSGLITITGGKLTGYRLMAKKIVDLVSKEIGAKNPCKTDTIVINGGEFKNPDEVYQYINNVKTKLRTAKIPELKAEYLVRNYGKQTEIILDNFFSKKRKHLIESEIWFALNYEGICTLEDFFNRRTGKLNFDPTNVLNEVEHILPIAKTYFNWNEDEAEKQLKALKNKLALKTDFV
ncbi:MAG: glycerol-3-phosphate dehydrogenase/oxidase [Flavobacteriales bacterium]|jgi:glycerol-3-phosphate dehydrogenase|nr:glycerol-3-phosphate dehydrogenase/oxidase [Flavobacteriales bacterium]